MQCHQTLAQLVFFLTNRRQCGLGPLGIVNRCFVADVEGLLFHHHPRLLERQLLLSCLIVQRLRAQLAPLFIDGSALPFHRFPKHFKCCQLGIKRATLHRHRLSLEPRALGFIDGTGEQVRSHPRLDGRIVQMVRSSHRSRVNLVFLLLPILRNRHMFPCGFGLRFAPLQIVAFGLHERGKIILQLDHLGLATKEVVGVECGHRFGGFLRGPHRGLDGRGQDVPMNAGLVKMQVCPQHVGHAKLRFGELHAVKQIGFLFVVALGREELRRR